jgi:hypothetical protein
MNGNSKAEKVERFIRDRVREALKERGYDFPQFGSALRDGSHVESLAIDIAYRVVREYSLIELADIMAWKKPKRVE